MLPAELRIRLLGVCHRSTRPTRLPRSLPASGCLARGSFTRRCPPCSRLAARWALTYGLLCCRAFSRFGFRSHSFAPILFDDASTRSTRRVHRITLDLVQACRPTWRVNYFFQHTFVATKNGNFAGTLQCTSTTNSLWPHHHLPEIVHRCVKRIAPPNADVARVSTQPAPVTYVIALFERSDPRCRTKKECVTNAKRRPRRRLGHMLQGLFERRRGDVRVACKRKIKGQSKHQRHRHQGR